MNPSIRCHDLFWHQLDLFDIIHKVLSVFEMMRGLANQGTDDVGLFVGYPICDGPSTRDNESDWGARFRYTG